MEDLREFTESTLGAIKGLLTMAGIDIRIVVDQANKKGDKQMANTAIHLYYKFVLKVLPAIINLNIQLGNDSSFEKRMYDRIKAEIKSAEDGGLTLQEIMDSLNITADGK